MNQRNATSLDVRSLQRLPSRFTRFRTNLPPEEIEGTVISEEPLEVVLNGRVVAVLMRTPGFEKELAAGFCLGEGLIDDASDILLVQHCGRTLLDPELGDDALDLSRNRVTVTARLQPREEDPREAVTRLIRSGCGRVDASEMIMDLSPIPNDGSLVQAEVLASLGDLIIAGQEAYRDSGGVHAAAIFSMQGQLVILQEDVGRHNAVDKATGFCLLRGIPMHDKILFCTGRASYDMVVKAVRLGIPIAASRSSPTSLAIELAEQLNATLVGYLRRQRFQVYAHPGRIRT